MPKKSSRKKKTTKKTKKKPSSKSSEPSVIPSLGKEPVKKTVNERKITTKKPPKKTSKQKSPSKSKKTTKAKSKKTTKAKSKKTTKAKSKKTTKAKSKKTTKAKSKKTTKAKRENLKEKKRSPPNKNDVALGDEDRPKEETDSELLKIDENLQKLITPEEREKMEENLDLVVCYLEDIGIVDLNVDREKLIITVPFDYEEFSFLSHIVLSPEWILIKTSIFELDQLSEMSIFNLFAEILKGNFILNSVVYALDPEHKSIWAQADIPIFSSFDTFKLNYFSIVFAIDYFMKNISPKANLQLKSTLDREEFKKSPSHLYI